MLTGSPEVDTVLLVAVCGFVGLFIGSFLNVVIYRVPAGESVVAPRSRCPRCETEIKAYDNIPVLSYLMLRGRCRACGLRISAQYPLVELGTAVATALCVWRFGVGFESLAAIGMSWCLITLSGIDARTQLLPDGLTLPLLWAGLLLSLVPLSVTPAQAIVGASVGYLSLWSVYWLFKLLTGKEGMGYGDFKLLGALGAWFGASSILPIVLMSSVVGAVIGGSMMALRGRDSQVPMPFGPFIAAAGFVYLVFAPQVRAWLPMFAF